MALKIAELLFQAVYTLPFPARGANAANSNSTSRFSYTQERIRCSRSIPYRHLRANKIREFLSVGKNRLRIPSSILDFSAESGGGWSHAAVANRISITEACMFYSYQIIGCG